LRFHDLVAVIVITVLSWRPAAGADVRV